ncbi:MAG: glycoside hydrolase family 9 protein [Plesiomonas sp.]
MLLVNHLGYERHGAKQAVLQAPSGLRGQQACLHRAEDNVVVCQVAIEQQGSVQGWKDRYFYTLNFSDYQCNGHFYLSLGTFRSHTFEIGEGLYLQNTLSDVLNYFKSQRCSGRYDQQDQQAVFFDHPEKAPVDLHGGWYDASGDVSKYLSHLSFANHMNPQQIPLVAWNMFRAAEILADDTRLKIQNLYHRMLDEALYGADFLVRMQAPEGYFYMTVFDRWSKQPEQRHICSYATQSGHKSDQWQAGFRQGGGVAIAALAEAARQTRHGEYDQGTYLRTALSGYWHLREYNTRYLDDGQENIIDEYCALLAATALYRATRDQRIQQECHYWAERLSSRQKSDHLQSHFWSSDEHGERPFYHASDAGLPVIALTYHLQHSALPAQTVQLQQVIEQAIQSELALTQQIFNPFGYPRQYVKGVQSAKRSSFFIPHDNESGYWWQGENARLGSLSCMAMLARPYLNTESNPQLTHAIKHYATHALDWILGLNPFDICMLEGAGHNNPTYLDAYPSAKGGVCNGITAGFEDEADLDFKPAAYADDIMQNWRWGEQWIPHASWYLFAITVMFKESSHV